MGDRPDARPLPTHDNTNTKKCGNTSMPGVRFEPRVPVFERPKAVCAADRLAIGTGDLLTSHSNIFFLSMCASPKWSLSFEFSG
jgi:hypothetical protein